MSGTNSDNTLTRSLFTHSRVYIYGIPPLKSIAQGHRAADWHVDKEAARIFTARLRILETSTLPPDDDDDIEVDTKVRTDVRLEDPDTGELFANCPYEGAFCVEQVVDSSRFFAVRVVDGPRKAWLGIGFEDRAAAFDFGVCLQEVRRQNGLDANLNGRQGGGYGLQKQRQQQGQPEKKDYSLKEGETIKITIGNKGRRKPPPASPPAPTPSVAIPFLPPPPSATEEKKRRRESYKQGDAARLEQWAIIQNQGTFVTPTDSAGETQTSTSSSGFDDDDAWGEFV